jgi:hypothetical protein
VATPAAQAAFQAMARFVSTLAPAQPFDFSTIDAHLASGKREADKPAKTKVDPPPFVFVASTESGHAHARDLPRPAAQDKASDRLKQLVNEWKPLENHAIYVPKWRLQQGLLASWAHL